MSDEEARKELEKLIVKYLSGSAEFQRLISIVRDRSRPGLPIRAVLEIIGKQGNASFDGGEKTLIEELIYLYG
jgi:hypothetical protein